MNKVVRILVLIIGVSAIIDIVNVLFINTEITEFFIIKYEVSKMAYLIYKFLIAFILITAGIKAKSKKTLN
ncbi:MAG: hypothetical protein QM486_07550 [Flavobacteriaceae bacterium]